MFKRDSKDTAFKTGEGPINVRVSQVNSIDFDGDYDKQNSQDKNGPSDVELRLNRQMMTEERDSRRNTQPTPQESTLPAVGRVGNA